MMRIGVTGSSGFVGRALVPALEQQGHEVVCIRRDGPFQLEGLEAVIHLAGLAHGGGRFSLAAYQDGNVALTRRLAAAARAGRVDRLVYVSSIRAQTGPVNAHTLTETDPPLPVDDYGRSKLEAERIIAGSGLDHVIFRPVLIYGPDAKGNMAQLMRAARSPFPLPCAGLTALRSILGMENVISALCWGLQTPSAGGETFIVADQTPLSVADMISLIRAARGRSAGLFRLPSFMMETLLGEAWQRLSQPLVVSPNKLLKAGWTPVHDSMEGIKKLARM